MHRTTIICSDNKLSSLAQRIETYPLLLSSRFTAERTEAHEPRYTSQFILPYEWFSLPKLGGDATSTRKMISRFRFPDDLI